MKTTYSIDSLIFFFRCRTIDLDRNIGQSCFRWAHISSHRKHIMSDTAAITSNETIITLNQDIGYLLLEHLDGLDAINFMEAVDGSQQFHEISLTKDGIFHKLFTKFNDEKKIKISIPYLDFYLETCCINSDGYLLPMKYHAGEPPLLRLFIHPTFTMQSLSRLCCTYKTPSFQCYTRLLPLNTHSYLGDLFVIDYFQYKDSIGFSRDMNVHEMALFRSKHC